jgi:hypothetical protein
MHLQKEISGKNINRIHNKMSWIRNTMTFQCKNNKQNAFVFNPDPEDNVKFREMGGLVGVAPACYDSYHSSNPDTSKQKKIQNGRHKQRALARQKKFRSINKLIYRNLFGTY